MTGTRDDILGDACFQHRLGQGLRRRAALRLIGTASLVTVTSPLLAAAAPLKIATIGAGRMGGSVGTAWAKAGHEVMFSSRHPEELKDLVGKAGSHAHAGTVKDAMAFGDVIVLIVPYSAMPDLAKEYGKVLAAKPLVIDVSNPFPDRDGEPGKIAAEKGAGTYMAELMPGVRFVRAFNAVNFAKLEGFGQQHIATPIAGDDAGALKLASDLIKEIGFEPVVMGNHKVGDQLIPRTPLTTGDHTAAELRKLAADLKK